MTHFVFLYSDDIQMNGKLAVLNGYRLVTDPCHCTPEIVKHKNSSIYGKLVEVDDFTLSMLDAYYCIGLDIYNRTTEYVYTNGGKYEAIVYVLNKEPVIGV